jgi:hypothetical protein
MVMGRDCDLPLPTNAPRENMFASSAMERAFASDWQPAAPFKQEEAESKDVELPAAI